MLGSQEFQILLIVAHDETRLLTVACGDMDRAQKWSQNSELTHRGTSAPD